MSWGRGCLIRRLKERLLTPKGQLICVGTSATLGPEQSEERSFQPLAKRASFWNRMLCNRTGVTN
jgi:hypothetical protein